MLLDFTHLGHHALPATHLSPAVPSAWPVQHYTLPGSPAARSGHTASAAGLRTEPVASPATVPQPRLDLWLRLLAGRPVEVLLVCMIMMAVIVSFHLSHPVHCLADAKRCLPALAAARCLLHQVVRLLLYCHLHALHHHQHQQLHQLHGSALVRPNTLRLLPLQPAGR